MKQEPSTWFNPHILYIFIQNPDTFSEVFLNRYVGARLVENRDVLRFRP